MTLPTPLPFGLRDIRLTPFTTDAATTLGTPVDLPNSRTLSFVESEDFETLRGDDKDVATHGAGPKVEWELEAGGVPFEAIKVMYGGTITDSGTTPNKKRILSKKVTDQRPYFKIEGQMISDSGGDMHIVIYKAKATDNLEGEAGDGQFMLTGASGIGLPSTVVADVDKAWDFVQNETAVAIP